MVLSVVQGAATINLSVDADLAASPLCGVNTWSPTRRSPCQNHRTCPYGSGVTTSGTASADVVCGTCAPGTYSDRNDRAACKAHSRCAQFEFQAVAPTDTSDRVCKTWSRCRPRREFVAAAPTATSDRLCQATSFCADDEFEAVAPTRTSDRICQVHTPCADDEFEAVAVSRMTAVVAVAEVEPKP